MGRWRAPEAPKSAYITRQGYDRLDAELKHLWNNARPAMVQKVAEAAAQGDRSENAAYIYGKKELRKIDRRVKYLAQRLANMTVVEHKPQDTNKVFFGAWVTVIYPDTRTTTYRIVGPDEINDKAGYVSVDSPLAKSLLGHVIGEEVCFISPRDGEVWVEISAVRYT